MATLTVTLVMDNDSVDLAASQQAFADALVKYVAERETEQSTIAATVASLFDKHLGAAINMPALGSMVCAALNAQPANYNTLRDLALKYIRDNASEKRENGKLFFIGKGKGGGVRRWAEIPVEVPKAKGAKATTPAAQ